MHKDRVGYYSPKTKLPSISGYLYPLLTTIIKIYHI